MKLAFTPLVVLIASAALVDALAHDPGQVSAGTSTTVKTVSEVNLDLSNDPKPEDVVPAPDAADVDSNEEFDDDDDEKSADEDEDAENVDPADEDEDIEKSRSTDEVNDADKAKLTDDDEYKNVGPDDEDKDADDVNDAVNNETGPEDFQDERQESVNSDDDLNTLANYSTSTVYTTVTSTVTDCESLATFCPEIGNIVTKTISLYTTICPESVTMPSIPLVTAPALPEEAKVSYLTQTIETTLWYTVTECPPQDADCEIGLEKSSVSTYYDILPVANDIPHTIHEHAPYPTITQSMPFVTGSPSGHYAPPQSNVTMPAVPLNLTYEGASTKNFDGFVMYFGLAVAATATALLQVW